MLTIEEKKSIPSQVITIIEKGVDPALAKYGLEGHGARVFLVDDVSLSAKGLHQSGQIGMLVNRMAALAYRFDDNRALEGVAFHNSAKYLGEYLMKDIERFVPDAMKYGWGGTTYSSAIKAIRQKVFGSAEVRTKPLLGRDKPVFVLFTTDGQNDDGDYRSLVEQVRSASYEGMFICFVALGADYGASVASAPKKSFLGGLFGGGDSGQKVPDQFKLLAELDDNVKGRLIDNADFFAVKSPGAISDEEMLARMLSEYPRWLKEARANGLIG